MNNLTDHQYVLRTPLPSLNRDQDNNALKDKLFEVGIHRRFTVAITRPHILIYVGRGQSK